MRKPVIRSALQAAQLTCSSLAFAATPRQTAAAPRAHQQRQPNLFDPHGPADAQRTSVRQLMQQNFQKARPEMQSLMQRRLAFEHATPGTSQFQSATSDLAATEATAARDQVQRQADLRTGIHNVLTFEQRIKPASLIQQRQQEMPQRRTATPAASN